MEGLPGQVEDDDYREETEVLEDILLGEWWKGSMGVREVGQGPLAAEDKDEESKRHGGK